MPETLSKDSITRLANVLSSVILTLGIVLYAVGNLGNRYFWSDEASSFLQSLGFPAIGQKSNSFADSWAANQGGLEPGMFNWLERYWALGIGTDIVTLRLFPFLLFLTYIASLLLLSRLVRAPWFLGCAVVGLMLLENITPYYGVELRPSIAGLAAAVILPLVTIWLTVARSKLLAILIFAATFIVFASMQYNTLPIIIGLAAILVVASLRAINLGQRLLFWAVAIISLLWLPALYLTFMGNPFDLVGGDALKNIPEAYIPNMELSEALRVIFTNFFSFTALPRTLFIVAVPLFWIFKKYPLPTREERREQWVVNAIWVAVFFATAASFLLGVLGLIPWILGTRWSISEVGLIALSLVGLVGLLAQSRFIAGGKTRLLVIILSLLLCVAGAFRFATYERNPGFNWNSTLETVLSGRPGGTIIDLWTYPELRYWVEYSGQYEQFREGWINHDIQIATPNDKASPEDIQIFLDSDADRFLLRSESLLEGIVIPPDVRVERIDFGGDESAYAIDYPVLLIRD